MVANRRVRKVAKHILFDVPRLRTRNGGPLVVSFLFTRSKSMLVIWVPARVSRLFRESAPGRSRLPVLCSKMVLAARQVRAFVGRAGESFFWCSRIREGLLSRWIVCYLAGCRDADDAIGLRSLDKARTCAGALCKGWQPWEQGRKPVALVVLRQERARSLVLGGRPEGGPIMTICSASRSGVDDCLCLQLEKLGCPGPGPSFLEWDRVCFLSP